MIRLKIGIVLCILSVGALTSWAHGITPLDTLRIPISVEVFYRQGHAQFDSTYQNNREKLDCLLEILHKLSSDSTCRLDRFSIVSGASPEGNTTLNKSLSKDRSRNIGDYLCRRIPAWQASLLRESYVGIDWDRLRLQVAQSDMPGKEDVMHILSNTPEWVIRDGVVVDSRKRQLMMLRQGDCWRYMEQHFFPGLRRSLVEVSYILLPQTPEPDYTPDVETEEVPQAERIDCVPMPEMTSESEPATQAQPSAPFYMAVKTNLLYDAFLVPNVGLEFYLGKGFSASGNWMYAWWKSDKRHRYWRIYDGELALRKYFGRPEGGSPLSGHHVGVYGQLFTYDFETGGRGYMGGKPGGTLWEKMNYAAGLEYGYSLPIANRLNLDFAIGVGYWGGTYYEYLPIDDCYVWQATKQHKWFGPTKAEITLVWLLGRGHHNQKKGDKR